jgi:hypothetical protein
MNKMEIKGALTLPNSNLTERITKELVINFGRRIAGNNTDVNKIFFLRGTIDESTGEIFWLGKSIRPKETF